MNYEVNILPKAEEQIIWHKRSGNKAVVGKITDLLAELEEHPRKGTGKPEQLKYELSGKWSRRINHEHRLIYTIKDEKVLVEVISAKGHYE
jgi:toxin YoeB